MHLIFIIKYWLFFIDVFRLGVLQTFISLGSIFGSILSPLIYSKSPTYSFALSSFFTMAGLLYTSLFLKETVVIKKVLFIYKWFENRLKKIVFNFYVDDFNNTFEGFTNQHWISCIELIRIIIINENVI